MRVGAVQLPPEVAEKIVAHATAARPLEACGFLIGADDASVFRGVPASNVWTPVDERTYRYAFAPAEQVAVERAARAEGTDVVGYYHSHPTGDAVPSGVDRDLAWPGYIYLIVGWTAAGPQVRAWTLDDRSGEFVEQDIESVG